MFTSTLLSVHRQIISLFLFATHSFSHQNNISHSFHFINFHLSPPSVPHFLSLTAVSYQNCLSRCCQLTFTALSECPSSATGPRSTYTIRALSQLSHSRRLYADSRTYAHLSHIPRPYIQAGIADNLSTLIINKAERKYFSCQRNQPRTPS